MRISIIIPCLNEGAVIGKLLKSLQPLRANGHEVVLVDGGSADETPSIAAPWVDLLVESDKGRARQMNAGAAVAQGDVLWFLHADSQLPEQVDSLLIKALSDSTKVWGHFDVRLSGRGWLIRLVEWMMNWRSRLTGIATGDQGIFVRTTVYKQVGGFPDIALMEDIALSKRLKHLSSPATLRQRLQTSSRRWERQGVIKTILLMWRLRLAYALGADPAILATRYRECSSPTQNS